LTGRELRKQRLLLGLTQRELAERLGMARNTITRYERGFLPTIPKYVELAVKGLVAEQRASSSRGSTRG
jgi:transcriptional regulator with XRE-family HTH domain